LKISSEDHIFLWENVHIIDGKNEVKVISQGLDENYEDNATFYKLDKPEESYILKDGGNSLILLK